MSRRPSGSVYQSGDSVYLSLTLDKRRHFRMETCHSKAEAEMLRPLIVETAAKLKKAGHLDRAIQFCEHATAANEETLGKLIRVMNGFLLGKEKPRPNIAKPVRAGRMMTVQEFSEQLWTNNELARRYRGRVREIDHTENIRRLKKHVYPVVFKGRSIGETPLDEFVLDHADHVLSQPTVPDGSIRHVAQVMHRLVSLAVYPARLLKQSPFPRGWLPATNAPKERSYLFPDEEAAVLGLPDSDLPLVWRIFFGFLQGKVCEEKTL